MDLKPQPRKTQECPRWVGVVFAPLIWLFAALKLVMDAVVQAINEWIGGAAEPASDAFRRGRQTLTAEKARELAESLCPPWERNIRFGVGLPWEAGPLSFVVAGATGSGKTLTIRLLMQSVLPEIVPGSDSRALIYDAKRDVLSLLCGMGLRCPVVTLSPFDERSAAWDMARDVTTPAAALQAAAILIPEEKGASQPFFADAARHLLYGVLVVYMNTAPGRWTFRDVLLALKSKKRLRRLLKRLPETQDLLEYWDDPRVLANIMSTVATKLSRYEPIAAAWARARARVSLQDWISGEFILVLGSDDSVRAALDPINQVLFKLLSDLVLDQTESTERRSWFFLDEVRQAGKLDGLGSLLTKGRSKGACVVLGFQDIEGMRSVYGDKEANELVGQCAHKALLRMESPATAEWASKVVGDYEALEFQQNRSWGPGGGSVSEVRQRMKREAMLPSEFQSIPPTTLQTGLTGIFCTPYIGVYEMTIEGQELSESLAPRSRRVRDFSPRPPGDQYLKPWRKTDLLRLGVVVTPPSSLPAEERRQKPEERKEKRPPRLVGGGNGSRADLIRRGLLVDVSVTARSEGFPIPVALTRGAWAVCGKGRDGGRRLKRLLRRLTTAVSQAGPVKEVVFPFIPYAAAETTAPDPVHVRASLGPDDEGKPCLTAGLAKRPVEE